jgi:release factor glutamine methyltransferase
VIDEMLPIIVQLLSPKGQFFLITIKDNNNPQLQQLMHSLGFNSKLILKRKAGIEGLSVTCFTRI